MCTPMITSALTKFHYRRIFKLQQEMDSRANTPMLILVYSQSESSDSFLIGQYI